MIPHKFMTPQYRKLVNGYDKKWALKNQHSCVSVRDVIESFVHLSKDPKYVLDVTKRRNKMERDEYDALRKFTENYKISPELLLLEKAVLERVIPIIQFLHSIENEEIRRLLTVAFAESIIISQSKNSDENFTIMKEIKDHLEDMDSIICKGDVKWY